MVVQPRNIVQLFTVELERILVSGRMFVDKRFAVWRIPYELAHVADRVSQVAGATQVVAMEVEEDVLTLVVGLEADAGLRLLWRFP